MAVVAFHFHTDMTLDASPNVAARFKDVVELLPSRFQPIATLDEDAGSATDPNEAAGDNRNTQALAKSNRKKKLTERVKPSVGIFIARSSQANPQRPVQRPPNSQTESS